MQRSFPVTTFDRAAKEKQQAFSDDFPTVSDAGRDTRDEKGVLNRYLPALGYEEENLYPGNGGWVEPPTVCPAQHRVVEERREP